MELKNILIVDDDSDDRDFFTSVIHELDPGIEVMATDSKQGLFTELDQKLPDLIFIDSLIQNESGVAGIREIKANPSHQHIPVIMYTGSSDGKNIATAFEAGAIAYITKPDTYGAIKKVMEMVLERDWSSPYTPKSIYNGKEFLNYTK